METTKREFDKFITQHGHKVLLGVTERKLHCECWDPRNNHGRSDCTQCFGLGWYYEWYKTIARRSNYQPESDKLDDSEPLNLRDIRYKYFFRTEVPLGLESIIIDGMNSPTLQTSSAQVFISRQPLTEYGENGAPVYNWTLADYEKPGFLDQLNAVVVEIDSKAEVL